jgi:hypothetical protein
MAIASATARVLAAAAAAMAGQVLAPCPYNPTRIFILFIIATLYKMYATVNFIYRMTGMKNAPKKDLSIKLIVTSNVVTTNLYIATVPTINEG